MSNHNIFIIAGETSGDMHGAKLVTQLKQAELNISISGFGGNAMKNAGVKLITHIDKLKIMGFSQIVFAAPNIIWQLLKLTYYLEKTNPDLVILIDYPGLNLIIAKIAKKLKIKVLYYIPPKIWASRPNRISSIKDNVTHVAVIFPFEVNLYQQHNIPISYVGNPLCEIRASHLELKKLKQKLNQKGPVFTLLPGSRKAEINHMAPIMLQATTLITKKHPNCQFILTVAPGAKKFYRKFHLPKNIILTDYNLAAMQVANIVIATSGTATLEATLLKKPMLVCYKTSLINALIAKKIITCKYIGLPNILANKSIVPEILQADLTADNLAKQATRLLSDNVTQRVMTNNLSEVSKVLNAPVRKTIIEIILELLTPQSKN